MRNLSGVRESGAEEGVAGYLSLGLEVLVPLGSYQRTGPALKTITLVPLMNTKEAKGESRDQ